MSALKPELHCAFCEKTSHEVKKLLEGASAYICDECVQICYDVVKGNPPETVSPATQITAKPSFPSPKKIKEHLDQYIIGQHTAKEIVSVAVYNHYKRLAHPVIDDVEIEKSNILLIGPTGSGKTLFARSIAKFIDVPFAIADATSLTEAGYVGDDVESIISRLLQAADYNVERAQRGIVYLDEIDKKARRGDTASGSKDVSGEGVQQALLKLLEGSEVFVPSSGGRKSASSDNIRIDTTNILFICGGAFVGIEKLIKNSARKDASSIGFHASVRSAATLDDVARVEPEHISSYGLIPELVGRLPIIAPLAELDEPQLVRVLTEPRNAVARQFVKLFALDEVELEFEAAALTEVARLSIKRKTGARGLRGVIEQQLTKLQFSLPDLRDEGLSKVVITKNSVSLGEEPVMIYKPIEKHIV